MDAGPGQDRAGLGRSRTGLARARHAACRGSTSRAAAAAWRHPFIDAFDGETQVPAGATDTWHVRRPHLVWASRFVDESALPRLCSRSTIARPPVGDEGFADDWRLWLKLSNLLGMRHPTQPLQIVAFSEFSTEQKASGAAALGAADVILTDGLAVEWEEALELAGPDERRLLVDLTGVPGISRSGNRHRGRRRHPRRHRLARPTDRRRPGSRGRRPRRPRNCRLGARRARTRRHSRRARAAALGRIDRAEHRADEAQGPAHRQDGEGEDLDLPCQARRGRHDQGPAH